MTDVGLVLPQLGPVTDRHVIKDVAQAAEDMGFAHLWVQDHFMYALDQEGEYGGSASAQPEVYKSVYAPLEVLAAVAAWTERIGIGSSILVAGNHWPVQFANELATIDQLSGGRLTAVGLGVGWSHEEHRAVGVDPRTRGRRIDEFVEVLKKCWAEDPVKHHGEFFDVPRSVIRPKPYQKPRPRLMSGMWSEKGLRRTALHYDLWNPGSMPIAQAAETLAGMNDMRPDGLEPLNVIYRAALQSTAGKTLTVEQVAERTVEAAEQGFEAVIIETNFCSDITSRQDWLDKVADLQPVLDAAHA
ncbi:LLM class F420-dependent oxidoreductase [Streptomyces sp. NWU339]|uniref:TIGR03619 family F420-dependent LLM class oxidoreductase n=1 Tax=Streptomyces sp. NWU339 TaxID=2185284 RepID=UPI000D67C159|nr:TIGR03619 family F420-dependent LLM class oxidoreductase [Streptomyces sp. NWU339]PWI10408.1 LLM class F420-dependent oxidoreductase [Streptomyces sp. NWU339]